MTQKEINFHKIKTYYITSDHDFVYFVGGTDIADEGNWEWSGTKTTLVFKDWGLNQPNGGRDENCMALNGDDEFRWHDYSCDGRHEFVCAEEDY